MVVDDDVAAAYRFACRDLAKLVRPMDRRRKQNYLGEILIPDSPLLRFEKSNSHDCPACSLTESREHFTYARIEEVTNIKILVVPVMIPERAGEPKGKDCCIGVCL